MKDIFSSLQLAVKDNLIDKIHSEHKLDAKEIPTTLYPNSYLILTSENDHQKNAIVKANSNGEVVRVKERSDIHLTGISPKDARQTMFADSLLSEDCLIISAIGPAGTGKTTLALGYAFQRHVETNQKIYLSKPTYLVGRGSRAFGPVPGDVADKYAPHTTHFTIVLKKLLGTNHSGSYIDILLQKKKIEYIPVEYTRGCTFDNCVFILDEAQNLDWHELKSVVSRIGENSKIILLGDLHQIDRKYSLQESGLYTMLTSRSYTESPISSCIYLKKQYRSKVVQLVSDIDTEIDQNANTKSKNGRQSLSNLRASTATG